MNFLHEPLAQARVLTMRAGDVPGRKRALKHHKAILAALVNGDAEDAAQQMMLHMTQFQDDIKQVLVARK